MSEALTADPDFAADDDALLLSGATTLVAGTTFCVGELSGDIEPERSQGLFVDDTRVLSRWRLRIDGAAVEPLSGDPTEPFEATYVGRAAPRPGHHDATVVVQRRRVLAANGMREELVLRNFSAETCGLHVVMEVDADFADLFEVKEGRSPQRTEVGRRAVGNDLLLWLHRAGSRRGVRISAEGGTATPEGLGFRALVPAQGTWSTTVEVMAGRGGHDHRDDRTGDRTGERVEPGPPALDEPLDAGPGTTGAAARMQTWRAELPRITAEHDALRTALARSRRDLGALRIVDRRHPDDDVVAAGAPWFMALFGRDSLLTSAMVLPFAPRLAMGTLRTLARLQGVRSDPMTDEQPGRILHEVRLGMDLSIALGGESVYYGSIDSTPLFVVLTDLALRWGVPQEQVLELMPAVDAAMEWMLEYGDRDGDGFLEYERGTDRGLLHQGWKDSHDGILFADGTPARTPIATAEVQGYAYAAFRARAHLAEVLGEPAAAGPWHQRAAALRQAFDERFWLPRRGCYALALDRDKRPVDALASNMGHCLWTGIVPPERVAPVADALLGPDMFTGFGVRTLARGMAAYNPVSYHNGSVWPHDTALAAAGLARSGQPAHALRVVDALLDASIAFHGRLPELFCGFDRSERPRPVVYPAACSPQAWAAATPFELLRTVLGLEACVPHGVLHVQPVPASLGSVSVHGLPLGGSRVDVVAGGGDVTVTGLPDGVQVRQVRGAPGCADGAAPA